MKHYYNSLSRAVTTDWMLKELDIQHEQININFSEDSPELRDLQAINPMGKLPTLVDGENIVTETAAICAYLSDKYLDKKLAPPFDSNLRAKYYRYLFITGNTMEPALTLAAANIEHPNSATAGWGDKTRVVATIEAMTPQKDWALGEQFTSADIVFGGFLDSAVTFGMLAPSSKVTAYICRIQQRPAYKEAHKHFSE